MYRDILGDGGLISGAKKTKTSFKASSPPESGLPNRYGTADRPVTVSRSDLFLRSQLSSPNNND